MQTAEGLVSHPPQRTERAEGRAGRPQGRRPGCGSPHLQETEHATGRVVGGGC